MSFSLAPDQDRRFVGMNFVQIVCKTFQQTTQGGEELDFLVAVKAAPHECVIRTGQP